MQSAGCAATLLLVSGAAFIACPFYRLTPRGLISLHFAAINWLSASNNLTQSPTDFLLPLATVFVLLDARIFFRQPECQVSAFFAVLSTCLLLTADLFVVLLTHIARIEIGLILISAVTILSVVVANTSIATAKDGYKEAEEWNSSDMFVDPSHPLHSLGSLGGIHAASVVILTALYVISLFMSLKHLIPLVTAPTWVTNVLYISRSLCSLSMLFTPANFGGFVQALKRTGRAMGSRFAQADTARNTVECVSE